jgi:hypothetical protein
MASHLRAGTGQFRSYVWLVIVFAAVATLLAAIGTYGVMAYTVDQRTREIGIRRALGAGRREIVALVGRRAIAFVAAGLILGLAGALVLTRLIRSQLWGVTPPDPLTFAAVSTLLVAIALLACVISRTAGVVSGSDDRAQERVRAASSASTALSGPCSALTCSPMSLAARLRAFICKQRRESAADARGRVLLRVDRAGDAQAFHAGGVVGLIVCEWDNDHGPAGRECRVERARAALMHDSRRRAGTVQNAAPIPRRTRGASW